MSDVDRVGIMVYLPSSEKRSVQAAAGLMGTSVSVYARNIIVERAREDLDREYTRRQRLPDDSGALESVRGGRPDDAIDDAADDADDPSCKACGVHLPAPGKEYCGMTSCTDGR